MLFYEILGFLDGFIVMFFLSVKNDKIVQKQPKIAFLVTFDSLFLREYQWYRENICMFEIGKDFILKIMLILLEQKLIFSVFILLHFSFSIIVFDVILFHFFQSKKWEFPFVFTASKKEIYITHLCERWQLFWKRLEYMIHDMG